MRQGHQRGKKSKRLVMIRRVSRIEDMTRDFDHEFWQALGPAAILKAAWELVEDAHLLKGGKKRELRLQRTIARFSKA